MAFLNVVRLGTMLAGAAGALLVSGLVLPRQSIAQSAGSVKPRFEVVSIHPASAQPDGRRCARTSTRDGGRVQVGCTSLKELLSESGVPNTRLVVPDWMEGGLRFDISAKLPDGATRDQIPQMFQSLLEDRFGLTFHHEVRDRPILALVVAKGGLKVQPAAPESAQPAWVAAAAKSLASSPGVRSLSVEGPDGGQMSILQTPSMGFVWRSVRKSNQIVHYEAPSITSEGLAELVVMVTASFRLGEEIRDMTGLKGRYQADFEVSLADLADVKAEIMTRPGDAAGQEAQLQDAQLGVVQDALKKLGLQLEPRKAPVELFVIDHLEKTPTEN